MADSEEFRLKRIKHEEHLSRVFDEVMGLGQFADSSRGSATSSKSSGQDDAKGTDKVSGQGEHQQVDEDSNGGRREEKMEEGMGEPSLPLISSTSSDQHSLFTVETNKRGPGRGTGRSGGGAFDDAVDGLEDDEDWHFALPMGSLEDANICEANRKESQPGAGHKGPLCDSLTCQPREEEQEEQEEQEREGSVGSSNTSHSSQEHTPDNSQGGVQNQTEETEDSQEGEKTEAAPAKESNPPISPIKIKDEPIDEGYDAALLPQSSIRQIKEELEHHEEELRISSVYSVGGANAFAAPPMPAAVPAPPPATIFIPSTSTVLQAMAPFPVRAPPFQIQNSLPALTQVPPRPPAPPVPGSVCCSGCCKVLLKGQTAFQRKGSTQLFCSTVCLTGHLPPVNKNRSCFQCNREILQPRDMVRIPKEDNTYMHFCGQFCLSVFRHKKKQVDKVPNKWPDKGQERKLEKPAERLPEKPVCNVCKVSNRLIEHEVTHHGRLHRLCSNACFVTWRKMRQLAMNCCEGCGLYCNSSSGSCQTLTIDRSQLNFCSPTCISTYKQTCRKMVECANCHKTTTASSTIMERDQRGKVQLYCSPVCVEQSRPGQHILSGAAFPCCRCKISAVPQYHLAMVDGTIRNFCSLDCVSLFRKSGHDSQPDLINGNLTPKDAPKPGPSVGTSSVPPVPQNYPSSVPYQGHHPGHTSVPPLVPPFPAMSSPSPGQAQLKVSAGQPLKAAEARPIGASKLTCHQCSKQFNIKPVLFSHQGRISMFCSKVCCEHYKTQKNILVVCEFCKQEKVLFDTINYNQQDMVFCSESCKALFKHELTRHNKERPWRPCTYCSGTSKKMLHSHYGGRMEEFCRPHCMSQYTILYYGMGRCDGCRKQGCMAEKLQCLGSVRNFCNLHCLLHYCSLHFETSHHTSSNGTGTAPQTPYGKLPLVQPNHCTKMNPVIADVVSLANGSATQPSVSADIALTGALPNSSIDGKNLDHASTQTDAVQVPLSRRRQMKNKSVLCRPFTMDQESFCQLSEPSTGSAAVSISAPTLLDSAVRPGRLTVDASTSPELSLEVREETQPCKGVPARLTGRHFLGKREADSDCKVCSRHKRKRGEEERDRKEEEKKEANEADGIKTHDKNEGEEHRDRQDGQQQSKTIRSQTSYYCKTCSGQPDLCPVPCFELYHTRLIYKTAPELETQALSAVSSSAEEEKVKVVMVPVPVPVFIPVPMKLYSQHTPVPFTIPLALPVPFVVPPQNKDTRDVAVQSEYLAEEKEIQTNERISSAGEGYQCPHCGDVKTSEVSQTIREEEETQKAVQAELPHPVSPQKSTESTDPHFNTRPEESTTSSDPQTMEQPPSSPIMDLETDFPSGDTSDQKPSAPRRGVKRPREGYPGRKRGRRRTTPLNSGAAVTPAAPKINHIYGVKAWKSWVQQRNKVPREVDVKEDVLQCDSGELSFALSRFIREARRPNGESYTPDSIFYLCLGIQQYLFMMGRIENIFTDELYSQFATEISGMLRLWKPQLLPNGVASSRVVESYLWECKQLGAYSPIVLLNTLLFFCTKNFHFTTLAQHQRLSFTNFARCSKPCKGAGKVLYLRHHRSSPAAPRETVLRFLASERLRKQQTEEERDLEMLENVTNPLHCPVRLYEFYLSRCQESVRKRTDVFYLQPEQDVHRHSSHWFTAEPLEDATLQSMLTRILAVREVHHGQEAGGRRYAATAEDNSLQ
ncbi:zinc finger MYM-type protein 4-like [Brachionichthys hirsutus]|uniref:zinc finger MYM-type protein 4-like n=1 Tax=Brachionichthys hirsutus TaxID=412623 RepID=UPI0036044CD6